MQVAAYQDKWPSDPLTSAKRLDISLRVCCYRIEVVTPFCSFSVGDLCTDLDILSAHNVSSDFL